MFRPLVHALAHQTGWSLRRAREQGAARVLMWHGIMPSEARPLVRQLRWLKKHFEIVSLPGLLERLEAQRLTGREVVLTFDDGLRSNATIAALLLAAHQAPATFFVCPGLIESGDWLWNHDARARLRSMEMGDRIAFVDDAGIAPSESPEAVLWEMKRLSIDEREAAHALLRERTPNFAPTVAQHAAYDMMSWEELLALDASLITIGSHTVDHPILPTLSDDAIDAQLAESRAMLEDKLGRPVPLFCYPNGAEDERVRAAARRHYDAAVATVPGLVRAGVDRFALPRIGVPDGLSELAWRFHRP